MTLSQVVDPNKWGEGWRWVIGGILFAAVTVGGMAITTSFTIGSYANEFIQLHQGQIDTKKALTDLGADQKNLHEALHTEHDDATKAATAAAEAATAAASLVTSTQRDLDESKKMNLPRIDRLEKTVYEQLLPALSRIEAGVDATRDITKGHDELLKQTHEDAAVVRQNIAPKTPHRGE